MLAQAFFFWIFAAMLVGSGLAVILARNPVHSVLFLILAFVSAAGLFVLLGAEFLAMMLIVVYVGAVAVLFLFVVMLLDVDFRADQAGLRAISADRRCLIAVCVGCELVVRHVGLHPLVQRGRRRRDFRHGTLSNTRALGLVHLHALLLFL